MNNFQPQPLTFWDWTQILIVSILGGIGVASALIHNSHLWGLVDIWLPLMVIYMTVKNRVEQPSK